MRLRTKFEQANALAMEPVPQTKDVSVYNGAAPFLALRPTDSD